MGTITRVECSVSLCSVRRIWNVLAGGQLLARLANHQKTVTSLCTASSAGPAATSAPRLLSGSLDGHVKVLPFLLRLQYPPCSSFYHSLWLHHLSWSDQPRLSEETGR